MRVGIQVGHSQRARYQADLVRGLVQPGAAQKARSLDDVELAELWCDHPDDVEAGAPDVRAGHVDRIRGRIVLRETITRDHDALEDVRARQSRDVASVTALGRAIEECSPCCS